MKLIKLSSIMMNPILVIGATTAANMEDSVVKGSTSYNNNGPHSWNNNESNFHTRRDLQKDKNTKGDKDESDNDSNDDGSSYTPDGVSLAVTAYWLIFNNPAKCISNPAGPQRCGNADWQNEETAVIHAVGGVSDSNGFLQMATTIVRSQPGGNLGLNTQMDPLQLKDAFTTAHPEVGLLLIDHGGITNMEQLLSFRYWEGCQSNNNCGEFAYTVYWNDMEEGSQSLMGYVDYYSNEGGGHAVLRRKNDGLQVYVEAQFPVFDLNDQEENHEEDFTSS